MDRSLENGRPRLTPPLAAVLAAVAALAAAASTPSEPSFSVTAPERMVTGRVRLEADARDARVESVRWEVDDWARTTPRPFALEFDLGPIPREATVTAVALDAARQVLYRRQAVLNPGGRRLVLEFLSPLDGERVSGPTNVARARGGAAGRRRSRPSRWTGRRAPVPLPAAEASSARRSTSRRARRR